MNSFIADYDSEIYANGEPLSVESSSNELVGGGGVGGRRFQRHPRSPPDDRNLSGPRYAPLIQGSRHSNVCVITIDLVGFHRHGLLLFSISRIRVLS